MHSCCMIFKSLINLFINSGNSNSSKCNLHINISTKHTVLCYSVVQNQPVINKGKEKMHCNSFLGKCVESVSKELLICVVLRKVMKMPVREKIGEQNLSHRLRWDKTTILYSSLSQSLALTVKLQLLFLYLAPSFLSF